MKKIHYTLCSNIGKRRRRNEDNYCCNGEILEKNQEYSKVTMDRTVYESQGLFAVFDGIGGLQSGENASRLAAEEVQWYSEKLKRYDADVELILKQCIMGINEKICVEAREKNRNIGTTAAVFYFRDDRGYIITIGDSRIYQFIQGRLLQVSRDDNMASEMEKAGILTPEQARKHIARHSLTQYLGMPKEELTIQPHYGVFPLSDEQQIFILCTDGLWGELGNEQIKNILQEAKDTNLAEALVKEVLKKEGKDNITVLTVEIIGGRNER